MSEMGVDWQRMDCPSCGEGLQCILCGADVRRFDDEAATRATIALYERLNPPSSPPAIYGAEWYRETAAIVLRAAGGADGC